MKYRLLAPHVGPAGELLDAGIEVGDETPYPWQDSKGNAIEPSTQMEGLDEEARGKIKELHQKLYGQDPAFEGNQSDEVRQAREKEAADQQKLDEDSEPVSEQQRVEREFAEEQEESDLARRRPKGEPVPTIPPRGAPTAQPGAARQPAQNANVSPTRGGQTTPAPGPATPKPPKADEARPTKPNEEQYPKG